MSVLSIQLISVYFSILLFFTAYKATNMELINALSNITPTLVKSTIDSALEIKSNKFRRKIYSTDSDTGDSHKKDYDIQVQMKRAGKNNGEPKIWNQWSNWSKCSVTCGIGTIMRWRHCIEGNCLLGEKKAQLKTCTSAAC